MSQTKQPNQEDVQPDIETTHAKFEATVDRSMLTSFIDVVDAVHHECKIIVDEDGIHTSFIGPANVAGVEVHLDAVGFESLSVDRPGAMSIDVEKIDDILGTMNSDLVDLTYDEDLVLYMDGGVVSFDAATISIDLVEMDPFDIDYDGRDSVTVTQTAECVSGSVSAARLADDHVMFCYDAERAVFIVGARGDIDQAQSEYGDSDEGYLSAIESLVDDGAKFSSLFDGDYVVNQLKPTGKETAISIQLAGDHPMVWKYTLNEHVRVKSLLAPRLPPE